MKLINCNELFSQDFIDDVKEDIDNYHQGFMIVNDELYIPRYRADLLGLDYDEDTECIVLDDYNKATAKDKLAQLFGNIDYITNVELIDLGEAVWANDLDTTLKLVLELCHNNYWQGYRDGVEA